MHVTCPGCGKPFKRSGLAHHLRQSKNPQCRSPGARQQLDHDLGMQEILGDIPPIPVSGPAVMDAHENEPREQFQLGVDPAGDVFGDYADYDFGIDAEVAEEDQDMDEPSTDEDESDGLAETQEEEEIALYDALLAEEEQRLEPERPSQCPGIADQESDRDLLNLHVPLRLRGGFEAPLSNRPEIMEFSTGNAGAVYKRNHRHGNQGYHQSVSPADNPNPYGPFSLKLDWEIAHWAKMRGPGSNALTELLSIEGVRLLWLCGKILMTY
jgi:hypothetical protein